jgi:hypothetical protein
MAGDFACLFCTLPQETEERNLQRLYTSRIRFFFFHPYYILRNDIAETVVLEAKISQRVRKKSDNMTEDSG